MYINYEINILGLSLFRLLGLFIGILFLLIVFIKLRKYSRHRYDTRLLLALGISLIILCLYPDSVNLPSHLLLLGDIPGGRIITLLLFSTALLWLIIIIERGKRLFYEYQFDTIIRKITIMEFLKNNKFEPYNDSIMVIIPAYNEEKNLDILLPKIPSKVNNYKVLPLVINDGSSDKTEEVAGKHDAMVINHLTNHGGGSALKTGFGIAEALNIPIVVTMDGDGQHKPEDIITLVTPIINNEADIVIGSRILGFYERDSMFRLAGVMLFSKFISIIMGQPITDCSSGYRAIRIAALGDLCLKQKQYHTAELIIEGLKRELRVKEQPITILSRLEGKSKKGTDFIYALRFLRTVITTWWR